MSQPEPEIYLFAVGSWVGFPVFLIVYVVVFLEAVLFYLCVCMFVFMSSPSLSKLLPEHNTIHYTKHKQT